MASDNKFFAICLLSCVLFGSCDKKQVPQPAPVSQPSTGKLHVTPQFQNGSAPGTKVGIATTAAQVAAHQYLQQRLVNGNSPATFDTLQPGTYFMEISIPLGTQSYFSQVQQVLVTSNQTTTATVTARIPADSILIYTDWSLTGHESANGGVVTNHLDFMLPCDRDDFLRFQAGGTGFEDEGPTKCAPEFPQRTLFTYSLTANDVELILRGTTFQIDTLTLSQLKLSYEYQGTTNRYTYIPY